MTENKWRENLKETTRLITSQAFSLKITNLILELQYVLEQQKQCLLTSSQVQPNPYKCFCKIRTCLQNLMAKRINP